MAKNYSSYNCTRATSNWVRLSNKMIPQLPFIHASLTLHKLTIQPWKKNCYLWSKPFASFVLCCTTVVLCTYIPIIGILHSRLSTPNVSYVGASFSKNLTRFFIISRVPKIRSRTFCLAFRDRRGGMPLCLNRVRLRSTTRLSIIKCHLLKMMSILVRHIPFRSYVTTMIYSSVF
jgi:hypothetical protein